MLSALFLASMLGLLLGTPSRARTIGAACAFVVYALGMAGLIGLIFLGKALG